MREPVPNFIANSKAILLWGAGFAVASILLAMLAASVSWPALRVVALLLSYVADFACLLCFLLAAWKGVQTWRSIVQMANQSPDGKNDINT